MQDGLSKTILPYSLVVGQEQLKSALELAYVVPRIGGVLISGHRGTGKSTVARAFATMMHGHLPVTLPINATEDRVVGGWKIDELMSGKAEPLNGLLKDANGRMLYVDEINLLDDHIVNIILDVTSTNLLVVQREGIRTEEHVSFTLVGTMNPEEGGLRPQLLDRFGLMVSVETETKQELRHQILKTVLDFEEGLERELANQTSSFLDRGRRQDQERCKIIERAREYLQEVEIPQLIVERCVTLAQHFEAEGHRGDYVMALAARAHAAINGDTCVTIDHVRKVAPLALQHRRPEAAQRDRGVWTPDDDATLDKILSHG